jgi:hypothetical protein
MCAFFLGGTCVVGVGASAGFGVGAGGRGLGLGEGAGGGGGAEEVEGEAEALVADACSFANRFMRIWGKRQSANIGYGHDGTRRVRGQHRRWDQSRTGLSS